MHLLRDASSGVRRRVESNALLDALVSWVHAYPPGRRAVQESSWERKSAVCPAGGSVSTSQFSKEVTSIQSGGVVENDNILGNNGKL